MKHIFTCVLIFLTVALFGQKNVEFDKNNFSKDQKKAFKEADKQREEGNELYEIKMYKQALKFFLAANDFNPNNSMLNLKIGTCYLLGSNQKIKSLKYFQKAYDLDPRVDPEIHLRLGQALHLNSEWDKAINEYKKYQKTFPANVPVEKKEMVEKKIGECETGKQLVKNPVRVFIDNMGPVVNSEYPEYGPVISADESVMMFTSRRNNTTGGEKDPSLDEYYEDIYLTRKADGAWTSPENMGKPINTDGHDATVGVSPDGQVMIIYLDDKGDGNLYQCELKGEEWSKPKKLGKNINSKHHESSAWYSSDGKKLYFVSNKPEESFGGRDIYISEWDADKERWKEPKNLGPNINTKYHEESIFIHPDGQTIYFSSQGHETMGGYDIFKSEVKNGMWSKPENIGHPINTPDNDVFFVMSGSGRRGYYSSFKKDGYGEKDLYVITFLGPEKPLVLNTEDNLLASKAEPVKETVIEPEVQVVKNKVTILKGIVRNAVTLEPLQAKIELMDLEKSEMVADFESNSKTGKYLVSLPSGKNYGIAVKADGYLFHSENFNIPESAAYKEVKKDIDLKKIEVGSTIILKNIFFDTDKYTLRSESTTELENLYNLLVENSGLKIEISGHTDSQGSDSYNQKLSENRAKVVVEYLIEKGIKKDRMTFKGYGEVQPIATNDTDEGRQMNRRTEFKVLGL